MKRRTRRVGILSEKRFRMASRLFVFVLIIIEKRQKTSSGRRGKYEKQTKFVVATLASGRRFFRRQPFETASAAQEVTGEKDDGGDRPRKRVRNENRFERRTRRKNERNPNDAQNANAEENRQRRKKGVAQAAQRVAANVHCAAKDIRRRENNDANFSGANRRFVRSENAEQFATEKERAAAEKETSDYVEQNAKRDRPLDSRIRTGADVLTDRRRRRGRERVLSDEN